MKHWRVPSLSLVAASILCATHCGGGGGSAPPGGGPSAPGVNRWTSLGQNLSSTYNNSAERTITSANVASLRELWRLETRGTVTSAPAIVDGTAYVVASGGVYAFNARTGQILWETGTINGTSSPAFSEGTVYVNDARGVLHALNAANGSERWSVAVDTHPYAAGYSSPVVSGRFLVVGSSSNEEYAVREDATFQGSVVAFDRNTGQELWRYRTAPPPFNGVAVWSTVSIDESARLVFATTGNTYTGQDSAPDSDAILAIELETGRLRWSRQVTTGDIFTILNPKGPDHDFGTNPILFEATIGGTRRRLVGAGQKSGRFIVLDRENGTPLWARQVGTGHEQSGGILNNGAFDGDRIIVACNRTGSSGPGSEPSDNTNFPGATAILMAIDPASGGVLWERQLPAFVWGPITVANGVGFVPVNRSLQAFRTDTGQKLFTFPTDGTIASAPVVAEGRVHFGSGLAYGSGTPGTRFYVLGLEAPGPTPTPTATPTPSRQPTFTAVYSEIIVARGCTGCHGTLGALAMNSKAEAYAQLVNVPAAGAPCVATGMLRVAPGNPDASLLVDKVSKAQPVCGDVMPPSGVLTAPEIEQLRAWIQAGAKND